MASARARILAVSVLLAGTARAAAGSVTAAAPPSPRAITAAAAAPAPGRLATHVAAPGHAGKTGSPGPVIGKGKHSPMRKMRRFARKLRRMMRGHDQEGADLQHPPGAD
jgi:hypothetical protein